MRTRILTVLAALLMIITTACIPQKKVKPPSMRQKTDISAKKQRFDRLVRDLHTLNLVNGLQLSNRQMQKMIPLIKQAEEADMRLKKARAEHLKRYNRVLETLRARLSSHNDITDKMQKSLNKASDPVERAMVYKRDILSKLTPKIKAILTANQRHMLSNYEPCMVPTPNVSNPERIGGTVDSQKFAKWLAWIRKMDEEEYQKEKRKMLDEKRRMMKVYNTDHQIKSVILQMDKAAVTARNLSDVEFEMRKDRLADIRMPVSTRKGREDEFIRRYLLNPFLIGIYKQRIKKAEESTPPEKP